MGLLGGIARTAVVAGTATAVSNRVSRRQAGRWAQKEQEQQPEYEQEPQYQQEPDAPEGDDMSSRLAQLKQLGDLKAQGVLTEAEFEQQKARILGS
jgi:Short C-terminal domain